VALTFFPYYVIKLVIPRKGGIQRKIERGGGSVKRTERGRVGVLKQDVYREIGGERLSHPSRSMELGTPKEHDLRGGKGSIHRKKGGKMRG